ncbi:MAG: bifunctional precorrin-2 dehydrogenase/sirohydrochlorin ferrochelatase [Magnetococcales bacterium]|nr:bifunctional precorrin-2 dehydrogenase/sirohydrochlorin ferrochelatase [Magnetococcales bacterium]
MAATDGTNEEREEGDGGNFPALPLFLRLEGLPVLLIGGFGEAVIKGRWLIEAGAKLTLTAERLHPDLRALAEQGRLRWLAEPFAPHHLEGQWLAVCAEEGEALRRAVAEAARQRRVWLNVVDGPRYCTVEWPAVIRRPPVMAAISTGGTSPALASYLRRRLEGVLPEEIGPLARWLGRWRRETREFLVNPAQRARFWRDLMDQGLAERYLSGDAAGAEAMIRQALISTTSRT